MKAREIMTPNPECVTPNDTVSRAAQIMRDLDVGFVPVVDDRSSRRLTGVITDRDIAVRHVAQGHRDDCTVKDHMTNERLDTVSPDTDVKEVMQLMQRDQLRRVPVVENGEKIVGIIAQADIAVRHAGPPEKVEQLMEGISKPAEPQR